MLIQNVHVRNFRSILDESLPCDALTALVGRNGSGKSSFLNALELFYNPSATVVPEDFYAEDVTKDIEIAVTFNNINSDARSLFSSYIDNDSLTVVRVFSDPHVGKSGTYHGMRLQNPDFVAVRNAGGAMDIRNQYNQLRKTAKYASLPIVNSVETARQSMSEWEAQNPGECTRLRESNQFFGFTPVGQGYLGRYTQYIHIPAVRNALDDATEKRGSAVSEIMDLIVRSALAQREDVKNFRQQTQDQYRKIMNPQNLSELDALAHNLSSTLQHYIPDAQVLLHWLEQAEISIPMPQAHVTLIEDEYEARVERTGHGLQRAFIITMLQHLDMARYVEPAGGMPAETQLSGAASRAQLPDLVLAIEEPELYQHPTRQRHFATVLLNLAAGTIPGVAERTQVIYATHSPLFVGLDRFNQIRVLRKVPPVQDGPKVTQLRKADMASVARELWNASDKQGEPFTPGTLQARLRSIMTPWMGEGFFADVVVLVEGEGDRAAILGFAKSKSIDFDSHGITIIPCFGKNNIDRPLVILRHLGVSVYAVWDGDFGGHDSKPEANRYLLRLLDEPEEDWPDFVRDLCACFKGTLEKTLAEEMGEEVFSQWLSEAQQRFGIPKKDHALKNPAIIEYVIDQAAANGKTSSSMESIVERIITLTSDS